MDLRTAYKILGLRFGADLETVKSTFRKRAFEYHPDLHPDDPQAGRKFHDLNQAYVTLKDYLASKEARTSTHNTTTSRTTTQSTTSQASQSASSTQTSSGQTTTTQKPDKDKTTKKGFAARQEETLKDILNDPFARQVFEDIFEKIKTSTPSASTRVEPSHGTRQKKLSLSWGKRSLDLDVTEGFFPGIKKWFGSQLDDHQTIRLPASQLRPGSMIRVSIDRRGKKTKAVELRLPHNFIVGRPIRLKGQGRNLGPFKGDLYLRFLAV